MTPPLLTVVPQKQADGYSSGSACVVMVAGALLAAQGMGVNGRTNLCSLYIREIMGIGDAEEMGTGLSAFGVDWHCHSCQDQSRDNAGKLLQYLDDGHLAILRGHRDGRVHWTLATRSYLDGIAIIDPEYGEENIVGEAEIEALLGQGDAEFWTIPCDSPCRDLKVHALDTTKRWIEALRLIAADSSMPFKDEGEVMTWLNTQAEPHNSVGIYNGSRLLGAIAMRQTDIRTACHMDDVMVGSAIQAMATHMGDERAMWVLTQAIDPDHRGMGYDRLLRAIPGELGSQWAFSFGRAGQSAANWQSHPHTVPFGLGRVMTVGRVDAIRPMVKDSIENTGTGPDDSECPSPTP